jgi:prolyl oligopeptidase
MTQTPIDTPPSTETPAELTYPPARRVEQTDEYFGTQVDDPYRWMEDVDSAELKTWVDAENELTQSYLAQVPGRDTMLARLMELTNFERYTAPARRGSRYFYAHNSGLQNQNVLYWQEGLDG